MGPRCISNPKRETTLSYRLSIQSRGICLNKHETFLLIIVNSEANGSTIHEEEHVMINMNESRRNLLVYTKCSSYTLRFPFVFSTEQPSRVHTTPIE